MSDHPPCKIEWEPISEGVFLTLRIPEIGHVPIKMPMTSVRELRDDMEEAAMLSRGLEKFDLMVNEVEDGDWIVILGDAYKVTSVLEGREGWILQFSLNDHSDEPTEVLMPGDKQVTIWRSVS